MPKKGNRKPTVHANHMISLRVDDETYAKIVTLSLQQNCSQAEAVRRVFHALQVTTKKPADGSP